MLIPLSTPDYFSHSTCLKGPIPTYLGEIADPAGHLNETLAPSQCKQFASENDVKEHIAKLHLLTSSHEYNEPPLNVLRKYAQHRLWLEKARMQPVSLVGIDRKSTRLN